MQISDDNQAHFSIYRTEIGSYAIGDALIDEHLFELCRDHGDALASLKFMVSHTSAAVRELQLDAPYTPKFYTIPPPTVLIRSSDVYSPARLQSPPRSLSSASDRMPQEFGGDYDASVSSDNADAAERDPNRTRIKRGSFKTTQRIAPPPLQPQSSSTVVERGHARTPPLRIKKHGLPSLLPQPLPAGTSRFPFTEDNYTLPTRRTPQASPSDVAKRKEEEVQRLEGCLAELRWELEEQKRRAKEEADGLRKCIVAARSREEVMRKGMNELEELKSRAQDEADWLRECIAEMQSKLEEDRHGSGKASVIYNLHVPPYPVREYPPLEGPLTQSFSMSAP